MGAALFRTLHNKDNDVTLPVRLGSLFATGPIRHDTEHQIHWAPIHEALIILDSHNRCNIYFALKYVILSASL